MTQDAVGMNTFLDFLIIIFVLVENYLFEDGMTDISMFRIVRDLMFIKHFKCTVRGTKTNLKMNTDRHLEFTMTRFRLGISDIAV